MAKRMEFKTLRESIEARLKELNAPGIKETDDVINARKRMQAMLDATVGICGMMNIAIEDDE